jgi:hypothetical protein
MANRKPARIIWVTSLTAIGLIFCFYMIANFNPMYPEKVCHVQGHAFDKSTNALANAKVELSGHGKVTAIDDMFSISPKEIYLEAMTDEHGAFEFSFRSSDFHLHIYKNGFKKMSLIILSFNGRLDKTHQGEQVLEMIESGNEVTTSQVDENNHDVRVSEFDDSRQDFEIYLNPG